jgi:hypothetical protein
MLKLNAQELKKSKKTLPKILIKSYGKYSKWDRASKHLPKLEELTYEVTAEVGVEFGMIVEFEQAKGRILEFRIDHPPFTDEKGNIEPSFEGSFQIKSNPYSFFLGDTVWEPVADKRGPWTMTVSVDGTELASKTILLT